MNSVINRKKARITLLLVGIFYFMLFSVFAQNKETIAVISIDSKNMEYDNEAMASMIRLELEKIDVYEVMDKYDVKDMMESYQISPETFGKNAVVGAGKLLGANKMLTGSVERFGEKIIMILRLVDVETSRIQKTSVMEFLNVQEEIQSMCMIALNELLGLENDKHLVDLLINYNLPIATKNTLANLSGPRMGMIFTGGDTGKRLQDSEQNGGYDMFPVSSMFGYQFEKQYLTSGDFQALVEVIPAINGLESGAFIPSISILNGFRFNNSGFEFGVGPIARISKVKEGYFQDGNWILAERQAPPEGVETIKRIDNRGTHELSMGLVLAFGKTFHSGYLNVPVNVYAIPKKEGTTVGITFGFNTTKKPKI